MKKFKNIFGTKENKKAETKAEAQAKAESLVEDNKVESQIADALSQSAEAPNEVASFLPPPSPDPLPAVAYEFEFDIVEYPSTLIETIKVIGRGTNEDECLRNAADTAKEKLKPSQHLRYTQKSLKQIAEGLN